MTKTLESALAGAVPNDEFRCALQRAADRFADYRDSVPLIGGTQSRTLLYRCPTFELVAMQWAPNASSDIHDHGDSRCWVVMLEGELLVTNYDRLDDGTETARLRASGLQSIRRGDVDHRLTWRELHMVANASPVSAYSLQLYAPALDAYTIVDATSGRVERVTSRYDSTYDLNV